MSGAFVRVCASGLLIAALAVAAPVEAEACVWDRDTISMERKRFPDAFQMIVGHFVHHGPAFYAWRIEDRTRRLRERPDDLALLDDLAAAYDKTGNPEAAVATMQRALKLAPQRYETHANLGTFLAHAGDFERSLQHVDRALEINPDAHFGRERYQALLIRYIAEKGGVARLPLSSGTGFVFYVAEHGPEANTAEAIKGVLGMMHFGKHDSPILLEALGDLLRPGTDEGDGSQLAAVAYLRASQLVDDAEARSAYRVKAKRALLRGDTASLQELERILETKLASAKAFVGKMRDDEERFLDLDDPEAAFDAAYFDGMDMSPPDPVETIGETPSWLGAAALGTAALFAMLWGGAARRRRRRGF